MDEHQEHTGATVNNGDVLDIFPPDIWHKILTRLSSKLIDFLKISYLNKNLYKIVDQRISHWFDKCRVYQLLREDTKEELRKYEDGRLPTVANIPIKRFRKILLMWTLIQKSEWEHSSMQELEPLLLYLFLLIA